MDAMPGGGVSEGDRWLDVMKEGGNGVRSRKAVRGLSRKDKLRIIEEMKFPGVKESGDLSGTTSGRSKKMTEEELELMRYKRRLRNRQSALESKKRKKLAAAFSSQNSFKESTHPLPNTSHGPHRHAEEQAAAGLLKLSSLGNGAAPLENTHNEVKSDPAKPLPIPLSNHTTHL